MIDTQEFINRLSKKLGRPTPTSVEPVKFSVPPYHLEALEERMDTMLSVWGSLAGKGVKASTPEEAAAAIKNWFGDLYIHWPAESIVTWEDLPEFAHQTFNILGWEVYSFSDLSTVRSERLNKIAQSQLGITGADYGVVYSGTLALKSSPQRGRSVSLLPPRHLAFLAASSIKNDLPELMNELKEAGNPPASIELISGPSRTSDIEMDLSIGVHGPSEVYLIIMADR